MERKFFLKNSVSALGLAFVAPLFKSCSKESDIVTADGSDSCSVTPEETAGPFPTHTPSSLVSSNIVSDRTGVPLTIKITVNNSKNSCAAFSGAIVDIWHCDASQKGFSKFECIK